MKVSVLLDTQAFLYSAQVDGDLTAKARTAFLNVHHLLLLSIVSIWEMQIKISLGKLKLPRSLRESVQKAMVDIGLEVLPVTPDHIYKLDDLPFHHRDPFDRLIAAQALTEKISIIGNDKIFDRYGVHRIW